MLNVKCWMLNIECWKCKWPEVVDEQQTDLLFWRGSHLSVRLNVPENGQTIFFLFSFENFVSLKI